MENEEKNEKGSWKVNVDGYEILVTNTSDITGLYVNGKLQDGICGFTTSARLEGQLPNGKKVRVSIGGTFKLKCYIFVDYECVLGE